MAVSLCDPLSPPCSNPSLLVLLLLLVLPLTSANCLSLIAYCCPFAKNGKGTTRPIMQVQFPQVRTRTVLGGELGRP